MHPTPGSKLDTVDATKEHRRRNHDMHKTMMTARSATMPLGRNVGTKDATKFMKLTRDLQNRNGLP